VVCCSIAAGRARTSIAPLLRVLSRTRSGPEAAFWRYNNSATV
jgi:hypothetical protein